MPAPNEMPFGSTRSRVTSHYALITPDTHVVSPLVGWKNASAVIHISPEMGARFTQYTAFLTAGAESSTPGPGVERFIYVLEGEVKVESSAGDYVLSKGGYALLPSDEKDTITSQGDAKLCVFEKRKNGVTPSATIGNIADVEGAIFMDDPDLRLQTLLPIEDSFDMAVNLFTYESGARLPQVEVHVMEHGLLMLEGEGVYRLGDDWFPVQAGDIIWMASYCPQWFVAMGKQPARYLYYKDIHRDRLTEKG